MTIIEKIAELHGVSAEECRKEMEAAIEAAGIDFDLDTFIALCSTRVMIERNKENKKSPG